MKKILLYSISIILLIACNSQQSVSYIEGQEVVKKLRNNQFVGMFVELNRMKTKENTNKDIYFKINESTYFVKYSEGYVSKEESLKYLNQKIMIKGELKTGEWEVGIPGSLNSLETPIPPRKGKYIVINKIYK